MGFFSLWRHWGALHRGTRRTAAIALITALISTALLYERNVRSQRPPVFSRGGPFAAGVEGARAEALDLLGSPVVSASPAPARSRSQFTVSAPDRDLSAPPGAPAAPVLPEIGIYTYSVDGYEEATGFGRREYPDTMTMTVHRTQPADPDVPKLREHEIIFDLDFSSNHEEREIVSYQGDGASFTYEAGEVTFGPVMQTSEATYEPPMLQVPFTLDFGVKRSGTSEASTPGGSVVRTEDWTVEVLGRETIEVMDETVDSWVVKISRQSRPGSSEQVTRTRQYWFDPGRMLWVKWTETLHGERPFGPGTFTYDTQFTANLTDIEPLS